MAKAVGERPVAVVELTAAGYTIGTATAIAARSLPALIVASGNDITGIRLPPATPGKVCYVKNTGVLGTGGLTGKLNVYPANTGGVQTIDAHTTGVAVAIDSLAAVTFIAKDSTGWYTFPAVAHVADVT